MVKVGFTNRAYLVHQSKLYRNCWHMRGIQWYIPKDWRPGSSDYCTFSKITRDRTEQWTKWIQMTQTKITENHMRTSQHTDVISDIFTIAGYLSTLEKLLPPGWLSKTTGLACRRIVRCFRSLIKPMGSQSSRCCSQDLANVTWLYEKNNAS